MTYYMESDIRADIHKIILKIIQEIYNHDIIFNIMHLIIPQTKTGVTAPLYDKCKEPAVFKIHDFITSGFNHFNQRMHKAM